MFLAIFPAFRLLSIYFQILGAILEELCCTETGEWAHSHGSGNLQAGKCKIYEKNTLQIHTSQDGTQTQGGKESGRFSGARGPNIDPWNLQAHAHTHRFSECAGRTRSSRQDEVCKLASGSQAAARRSIDLIHSEAWAFFWGRGAQDPRTRPPLDRMRHQLSVERLQVPAATS